MRPTDKTDRGKQVNGQTETDRDGLKQTKEDRHEVRGNASSRQLTGYRSESDVNVRVEMVGGKIFYLKEGQSEF